MAQTNAERSRNKRQRKIERGLVKVEVWVPPDKIHIVKKLEQKLGGG